jgi:hypothetical protein
MAFPQLFFFILFSFSSLSSFLSPSTEAFGDRARKEFESDTRASSGLFLLVWFGLVRFGLAWFAL